MHVKNDNFKTTKQKSYMIIGYTWGISIEIPLKNDWLECILHM